jgi:hypothetical protein
MDRIRLRVSSKILISCVSFKEPNPENPENPENPDLNLRMDRMRFLVGIQSPKPLNH